MALRLLDHSLISKSTSHIYFDWYLLISLVVIRQKDLAFFGTSLHSYASALHIEILTSSSLCDVINE